MEPYTTAGLEGSMRRRRRRPFRAARLPERPGEPDCAYYVNFGICCFGEDCKFNHPRDHTSVLVGDLDAPAASMRRRRPRLGVDGEAGAAKLPERPGEPDCAYYVNFGTCCFGEDCKFNHPLHRTSLDEAAEPLLLLEHPADSGSNNQEQEDAVDVGADISLQPEPSLPLQHPADSGSINSLPEVVVDAGADVSLLADPFLQLQYPGDSGSNNSLPEVVVDAGADVSLQTHPFLQLQYPGDSRSNNSLPEVVVDAGADVSLQAHPFLPLQYPADRGRNNSLPEVVVDVDAELSASMSTAQHVEENVHGTPDDQIIKEQQDRCIKYSKKALGFALGFALATFIDYAVSVSSARYTVLTKASMAAFFVAICSDLFSLMKPPKWSCTLVYVSWFHLVLMTTLIFVSLNKDYVYAILIVPLMIGAALLQHKLWPQERRRSTGDDRADQQLEGIFNLSALILNLGSPITAVVSIVRRIISGPGNYRTVRAAGFLCFFTVVVGLYLMMVMTVRHAALTLHAKYLHNLFIGLVVGTLITTLGSIWFH